MALCAKRKAGELEAVLELQIIEFSAFVNVKGDCRQNVLGTILRQKLKCPSASIRKGISLLAALLLW